MQIRHDKGAIYISFENSAVYHLTEQEAIYLIGREGQGLLAKAIDEARVFNRAEKLKRLEQLRQEIKEIEQWI